MHVLLFVLHVCMLRECEGERVTEMLVWGPGEVWLDLGGVRGVWGEDWVRAFLILEGHGKSGICVCFWLRWCG